MVDDPEADISLTNLLHGLDSSLDESTSGLDRHDLTAMRSSHPGSHKDGMEESQLNLLQGMVLEMKEAFQSALKELAKIQGKEDGETSHSKNLQHQQQRQLDHVTETIGEIKHQLSSLATSIEQIQDEQKVLKDQMEEVMSNGGRSQEHKVHNGKNRPNLHDNVSICSETGNPKFLDTAAKIGDQTAPNRVTSRADDVTAIACKSLSLTQALGEECLKFSQSQSSNDEDEDEEILRASSYRQKAANHVVDQTSYRQHRVLASAGWHYKASNTAQRQKAVTELADGERDYCSKLWSLLRTYLTPLQTAGFLSSRELDMLIPRYLDQMYTEHYRFCTELQDRLMHWTHTTTLADLLTWVTDSYNSESLLFLYKEYAYDLPAALTYLRRALAQSSQLQVFLKAIKLSICESEDLMSLLLSPVQRMPKLLLQLQEISIHTPPSHADFPHFEAILHRLQSFVDYLNDKLFNTIEDLNQDGQARSEYMNEHLMDARDSGQHSTSPEDDQITSARAFFKSTRSHMPSEWQENSYYNTHPRQPWASPGRLSQPDLFAYQNVNMSSDSQMLSQIPRSHSALSSGGGGDSDNDVSTRQRIQKFKIKKRNPTLTGYLSTTQDYVPYNLPFGVRSSSSVDFIKHSNHRQQQHHKYSDLPGQSRNCQGPVPQPRPRSALGLNVLSTSHRPVVISRKTVRRSEPQLSTSNTVWTESTSSANLPDQADHQKKHLTDPGLPPQRPPTRQISNNFDGHDDEEDDTRTFENNSFGTSGSHSYVRSHSSNDAHEMELFLNQDHVDSPSPQSASRTSGTAHSPQVDCTQIPANGSRRLYSTQPDLRDDGSVSLSLAGTDVSEPKISKLKEQSSKPVIKERKDVSIQKQHVVANNVISNNKSIHATKLNSGQASVKDTQQDSSSFQNAKYLNIDNTTTAVTSTEHTILQQELESLLPTGKNSVQTISNPGSFVDKLTDGEKVARSELILKSNKEFLKSLASKNSNMEQVELNKTSLVNNRKVLESFASRSSNVEQINPNKTSSVGNKRQLLKSFTRRDSNEDEVDLTKTSNSSSHSVGKSQEDSTKTTCAQPSYDANVSLSPNFKMGSSNALPYAPPRSSKTGSSQNQISDIKDNLGPSNAKPVPFPKKHPKTSVLSVPASNKDGVRMSYHMATSPSSLKYDADLDQTASSSNQTMSSSSLTYSRSPSFSSQNTSILRKLNSPSADHKSPAKPNRLYTSSTTNAADATARLSKTLATQSSTATQSNANTQSSATTQSIATTQSSATRQSSTTTQSSATIQSSATRKNSATTQSSDSHGNGYNHHSSYHDTHELPPLDIADLDTDGLRGRRKESAKTDESNVTLADGQLMASEDRVNGRKKIAFKASFKNLFAKKKGRVILADVEKEVIMEMISEAVTPPLSSDITIIPRNNPYSRSKKMEKFKSSFCFDHWIQRRTSGESPMEIKTLRDQASSTSSPVKADKNFHFCTVQVNPGHGRTNGRSSCREHNFAESGKLQQESRLECPKTHKLHCTVIDQTDAAKSAKMLDGGLDSLHASGQTSCSKSCSYAEKRYLIKSPHLQECPTKLKCFQECPTKLTCFQECPTKLPRLQECPTKSPHFQESCSQPSLSQQSSKPPAFQQSLVKLPVVHKSLTKSRSSQQILTKSPFSQNYRTKSLDFQENATNLSPVQPDSQKEVVMDSTTNTDDKLHNKPLACLYKRILLRQFQNKNNHQKSITEIRKPASSDEMDLLKSLDVCRNDMQDDTVCKIDTNKKVNHSISKNQVMPRKLECHFHKDYHQNKSQPSSRDLCRQCQTYGLRSSKRTEDRDYLNTIDCIARKDNNSKVLDKVSRRSDYFKSINQDSRSCGYITDTVVGHSLLFQGNNLSRAALEDGKSLLTQNIGQCSYFRHPDIGTCTESLKPCVGNSTGSLKPCVGNSTEGLKSCVGNSTGSLKPCVGNSTGSLKHCVGNSTESLKPCVGNSTESLKPCVGNSTESLKPCVGNSTGSLKPCVGNSTESLKPCVGNSTESLKPCVGNSTGSLKPCVGNSTVSLKSYVLNCAVSLKSYVLNCAEILKPNVENCAEISKPNVGNCAEISKPNVGNCAEISKPNVENCAESLKPNFGNCAEISKPNVENCAEISKPNVGNCAEISKPNVGNCAEISKPNVGNCAEISKPNVQNCAEILKPNVENCAEILKPYVGNCAEILNNYVDGRLLHNTKNNKKITSTSCVPCPSHQKETHWNRPKTDILSPVCESPGSLIDKPDDLYHMLELPDSMPMSNEDNRAQDLLPTTSDLTASKSNLNKDGSDSSVPEESDSDVLVKCFPLDDRESFEHRYRLYFEDETLAQESERA